MNYENLYQTLQPQEKSVKDSLASLQKLFKAASRETESGDIKSLTRDIGSMAEAALALSSALEDIKDNLGSFDTKTYFESGDFAAQMLEACQEKLNKAPFNALTFAGELSDAYELAILKLKKNPESDIYLTSLYKFLAPMSRFRKDYDQQSFAFDLARLFISGIKETKNGKKFQFGPSRNSNKCIRILNADGKEEFLATIRFYQEQNLD